MINKKFFGNECSPLREDPVFRRYMEEYAIIDNKIDKLNERRGYLSYNEVMELSTLKKIKLTIKDEMEKCKQKVRDTKRGKL